MIFALDKDGKRTYIENTHVNQVYFCPVCGEKMILKKGEIKRHHFAHQPNSQCSDHWHYDMSEWHQRWQSLFPLNTREIVKEKNGVKHRADVLLEDKKIVLEFQHSSLSPEEFEDRNEFYTSLGYKVIWIFDLVDQFDAKEIGYHRKNVYKWSHPRKTFDDFNPKDSSVLLFFQYQIDAKYNEDFQSIKKELKTNFEVMNDEEEYYEEHKNDKDALIKVTWAPESGFEYFACDGNEYNAECFTKLFNNEKKEEVCLFGDLLDELKELYSQDHTQYYSGCPISSTHLCWSTRIDIPENKWKEIMQCDACKCFVETKNNKIGYCRKRFLDLNLSPETKVIVKKRNQDGFITQFAYEDENGKKQIVNLPTFIGKGKSIFQLWKENNYKVARFVNVRTGYFVTISKNPLEQRNKYGKVYGKYNKDQYSSGQKDGEIYGCENPEWLCIWCIRN